MGDARLRLMRNKNRLSDTDMLTKVRFYQYAMKKRANMNGLKKYLGQRPQGSVLSSHKIQSLHTTGATVVASIFQNLFS